MCQKLGFVDLLLAVLLVRQMCLESLVVGACALKQRFDVARNIVLSDQFRCAQN